MNHWIDRRGLLRATAAATLVVASARRLRFGSGLAEAATWPPRGGHVQVTRQRILEQTAIPVYGYKVVETYPHDRMSYTEGLVMDGGSIFEGTGLYGQSKLLQWDLHTGRVLNRFDLDSHYFGEGVTVMNGVIYQLTYLANTAFTYDQNTFRRDDSFHYVTQGWGLTHDGKQLIMGDGSSAVIFLDPHTFEIQHQIFRL